MTELYPSDDQLNALSGTNDAEQEVLFVSTGESPYYTSFYKMLSRLLDVARRAGDLRVCKDGDLTFGVRAGRFSYGGTDVNYTGDTGQALTNNQTNYVYLTTAGALTINTTGFPTTPCVPLATILTAAGVFGLTDVTDCRQRAVVAPVGVAITRFGVPLTDVLRTGDLSALPTAGDGTNLGRSAGAHGTDTPSLSTTVLNNNSITEKARFLLALPPEYVDGEDVTLRLSVYGPDVNVSATLDVEVYESDREAGVSGGDLYAGAAVDIDNHPWGDEDFTITGTNLVGGDVLDIELTVVADDTGGAAGISAGIGAVELLVPTTAQG